MKRRKPTERDLDQRVRVTLPGRPITRSITPREVEAYMRAMGWREADRGPIPSPRDRETSLSSIIRAIAAHEKRAPGSVLKDIAEGRGMRRFLRSRKRWPLWP